MKNFRSIFVCSASIFVLGGCSGGGYPAQTGYVTRDTEPGISQDALILAAGVSTTPWVQLATAQQIDAELSEIRAATPALAAIHARGDEDPKSLIFVVKPGTAWLASWKSGKLATGESGLDDALETYRAKGVSLIGDNIGVVTFDQWMNAKNLSSALGGLSSSVEKVELNGYIGDGDRILGAKPGVRYEFQKGWGDCPAGCTSRHTWTATRSGSGWNVTESGAPLDGG